MLQHITGAEQQVQKFKFTSPKFLEYQAKFEQIMKLAETDFDHFESARAIKHNDADPNRLVNSIMRFQFEQMKLKLEDVRDALLLLDFMWRWIDLLDVDKPKFKTDFQEIVYNLNTLYVIYNGYRELYTILTQGLLRTDKRLTPTDRCQTHSFFTDPPIPASLFSPQSGKIINITYMSHSSILFGDNGATKTFKLPWNVCINFVNEVASEIRYPQANEKLQMLQNKSVEIHGSYWVGSKDEDVYYPDLVLHYDKPKELLTSKHKFRYPTWRSVVEYKKHDDEASTCREVKQERF